MAAPAPTAASLRALPAGRVAAFARAGGLFCVAVAAAAFALRVGNVPEPGPDEGDYAIGGIVAGVAFGLTGGAVAARAPRNAVGWLALGVGAAQALAALAGEYAHYGVLTAPGAVPGVTWAYWVAGWLWFPAYAAVATLLLLLFPDGRLPGRRWRPVGWACAVVIALGTAGWALTPYDVLEKAEGVTGLPGLANPLAGGSGDALAVVPLSPLLAAFALCALASLASLVVRVRRARGVERQQLKWLALGGGLTVTLFAAGQLLGPPGAPLVAVAMVPLPAAMALAALRHGLWDVDLVINRSLVYGGLTLGVAGAYVAAVALLGGLLGGKLGAPLLAAGLVAVAVEPARRRLQRAVNRLLYGARDDPAAAVATLGRRLEATGAPEELLQGSAEAIARALRLPHVAIEVPGGLGGAHGRASGEELRLALVHRGEQVGELVASARAPGTGFSRADRRALDGLARQVAVAAHAVRLTEDLRRSRERLVSAGEDERRRLRRELHDGLGPALAAVALQLDTARELAAAGAPGAEALLETLASDVREQVAEVRRVAHDLRPPTLDELGLAGALREQARRFSGPALRVEVVAGELGALPAAAEAAAYRIVGEALANASRHAGARTCTVVLERHPGALEVAVTDDGRGLPDVVRPGVGLASMRERATELGGVCTIAASPTRSGCEVRARLPLEAA